MTISTHYLGKILKIYQSQLEVASKKKNTPDKAIHKWKDKVTISQEGKKRQIFEEAVLEALNEFSSKDKR